MRIPMQRVGMLSEIMDSYLDQKNKGDLLRQKQFENIQKAKMYEQKQKYDQEMLNYKMQSLDPNNATNKLKTDLLRAQIEHQKAKTDAAKKGGPATEYDKVLERQKAMADIKENNEKSKHLESMAELLNPYVSHLSALDKLLKNSKGNVTGLKATIKHGLRRGSPETGAFLTHSTPLVGKLAKDISSRGGAVVSGIAQAGKTDVKQPEDYNLRMVKEMVLETIPIMQQYNEQYKKLHPDSAPPFKIPEDLMSYFGNEDGTITIIDPKGGEHVIDASHQEAALKKYPGSKVKK